MSSSQQIFVRVDALQTSIKETLQLIQRLATLHPDDSDTNSQEALGDTYRADLAAEIHDGLKQHEEEFEMIQQDTEDIVGAASHDTRSRRSGNHVTKRDQERERESAELLARTSKLSEDLRLARIRYRKAQLQAKRNADLAEEQERAEHIRALQAAAEALAKEREVIAEVPQDHRSPTEMRTALFASRRPASRNTKQTQDDMVLNASSDLTSSLRRTHALLTDEVSRSRFAHETLEQSNAALTELNERYGALDGLLAKSRGLLGTLVRSQKSDTWYLQTTLYMLAATIAWLVFRRLFYGPLWWFVYLPFKLWYSMSWWVMSSIWGVAMTTKNNTIVLGTQEPLRVMPSASNRAPTFSKRGEQAYMPVGAGGVGAKQGLSSMSSSVQNDTPMSDMVSKMVEASKAMADATSSVVEEVEAQMTAGSDAAGASDGQGPQGQQGQQHAAAGPAQPAAGVRRGDGQVLPERDEATQPRNPKKRMMEVPPEPPMEQRDEL